jgi:hypothetical protein
VRRSLQLDLQRKHNVLVVPANLVSQHGAQILFDWVCGRRFVDERPNAVTVQDPVVVGNCL